MNPDLYNSLSDIEDTHWWFVARRKYLDKLIHKYVQADKDNVFCEVGCGTGGNLSLLTRHADVDAVEIEENALKIAKGKSIKGVRSIEHGFLPDNIPFEGPYTAIFSLDVIEHVEQDLASIRTLQNLSDKNGTIIITVPAYQWLWSSHDIQSHHFRRYTKTQITKLANEAGLQVIYASYFNTILFPLAVISRVKDKLASYFGKPTSEQSHLDIPPKFVNQLFTNIFSLERYSAGKFSLPFGLSIVVVARPKQ